MPALKPSDAVILGIIAKQAANGQPNSPRRQSSKQLLERLTQPARPLGEALVQVQEGKALPLTADANVREAVEFLQRWGGNPGK